MTRKILFVITGLERGGAEMMLFKLLSHLDRTQFTPVVFSLKSQGDLINEFKKLGIAVYSPSIKECTFFLKIFKLKKILRQIDPDLIQGWMYHGNLFAHYFRLFLKKKVPLILGIRQSLYDFTYERLLTKYIIKLDAMLSRYAQGIIHVSEIGRQQHQELRYNSKNSRVIHAGFETELYKPQPQARENLLKFLNLPENVRLIGCIARFHPIKDHITFIKAAQILLKLKTDVHFILIGSGVNYENSIFKNLILQDPIMYKHFHLLGERKNIAALVSGLDLASLCSISEGLPNVIGEAMSAGVPCVATDVGDTAFLMGDTGLIISPQNPQQLAEAWKTLLEKSKQEHKDLGAQARQRILNHFSIERACRSYQNYYLEILNQRI